MMGATGVSGPDAAASKPRLVFFRATRRGLPDFVHRHLREHVKCLSQHFDVVLVTGDCDYLEVCETHQPDITLFESGVYVGSRKIAMTSACPEIPKIGFCNADAYCPTRSVFLSDMERWGVETFFSLSVAMAEYTPEIADHLFVWPNFVDTDVYRDYRQPKNIPVLFTGSQAAHYPWRSGIHNVVTPHYACLTTPHSGWFDRNAAGNMVHGVAYAKLLNAAWVAPTCGTIARELVRKHLEIPATRTCLVTERTRSLEAAGFVDMQNVVFAEPGDVLDKMDFLFAHPEEMRRIIDAGYELVHSRHTMAHRDQLYQWFSLNKSARPGQRIVQSGPFEALRLVWSSPGVGNSHPIGGGLDRALLHEGERLLGLGRYERAEKSFLRCLNYHFMPEPVLGLARCHLYGGDAEAATRWVIRPIERSLRTHLARDPDPVEWAFYVRTFLCRGKVDEAARRAEQFPNLRHLELDRIRGVAFALAGRDPDRTAAGTRQALGRQSVHVLPELDMDAWIADLCVMLRACRQSRLAGAVAARSARRARPSGLSHRIGKAALRTTVQTVGVEVLPLLAERPNVRLMRRVKQTALWARSRDRVRTGQHMIVRNLAQKEDIRSALLISTSASGGCTRAVVAGLLANVNQPEILWLLDATPPLLPHPLRLPGERLPRADALADRRQENLAELDLVVVGMHSHLDHHAFEALAGARFVVLAGIDRSPNEGIHSRLIVDVSYALVTHYSSHRNGYSVFRRVSVGCAPRRAAPDGIPAPSHETVEQAMA